MIQRQPPNGLQILKRLWKRFWEQSIVFKLITIVVILLTLLWMVIFYSSFLIWKIFSYIALKPMLYFIEWYLDKTEKPH
ncbi:MAG: hypothetical protein JSS07_08290 [Proteobacteria bacterium]|nr:hypothetical protein [Pseudomonadota bacterium]